MTISATTNKIIAQGNGATTVFSFNFLVQSADQLAVVYTDANGNATPLAANLYSASGLGNANGGTVTYPLAGSPIASGTSLTIYRTVSLKQLTSLKDQGSYNPAVVEAALDYLTMITQQFNELLARSITVPVQDVNPTVTLPAQAARKNTMVGFDANGVMTLLANLNTLAISGYMTTMLTEANAAAALAYLTAAADSAVVHNTGNETVAGFKTFQNHVYVTTITTASLVSGAFETETITHGLGSDDVEVTVLAKNNGTTAGAWAAGVIRPDDKNARAGGYNATAFPGNYTGGTPPATGNVHVDLFNTLGVSATVTARIIVRRLT